MLSGFQLLISADCPPPHSLPAPPPPPLGAQGPYGLEVTIIGECLILARLLKARADKSMLYKAIIAVANFSLLILTVSLINNSC